MLFRKVAVVGVGLIGGSFALALKQAKACAHVVGAGRSAANMKLALDRGVIDSIEGDAARAVEDADLVMVATPAGQFAAVFQKIGAALKPEAIVTDAGSTKREVIEAARKALKKRIGQFVPAHPIAGAEKSGVTAASAELFRGKRVVLAPLPENSEAAIEKLNQAWATCGARTSRMTPEQHDEVFGTVSHLPHLLAYALVNEVTKRENAAELFAYAAGGFRDFTRIASASPEMWRDISLANADVLATELTRYSKKLAELKKLLESGDAAALQKLFAEARSARDDWLQRTWSGRKPGA